MFAVCFAVERDMDSTVKRGFPARGKAKRYPYNFAFIHKISIKTMDKRASDFREKKRL
jgi:hypothetical protein